MILGGRHVLLGVSGGIAAYKACIVARRLTDAGAQVTVVQTAAAAEFVRPVTFEAITGQPVRTSLWEPGAALTHVELGRSDVIVVAPATANLIAKASAGIADDHLTATLLAADAPVVIAPAMNDQMFAHPATESNLAQLRARGWTVVGPEIGPLAEGSSLRPGRMSEPESIVAVAIRIVRGQQSPLRGRRVVVTAGPTREPIDPVRVLTNRSSGRMGLELAAAAFGRGADVTLVTGPTSLPLPYGVSSVRIETTRELQEAVANAVPDADVLIMAAAPADFRPRHPAMEKQPRRGDSATLELEPTDDILQATHGMRKPGCIAVGFALETHDGPAHARAKLEAKGLDLIVLNMATEPGAGFEVPTNRVTVLGSDGTHEWPLLSKRDVAERLLDTVESMV